MALGADRGSLAGALLVASGVAALLAGSGCRRQRPTIARSDAAVVLLQAPLPVPPGVKTVVREAAPAGGAPMTLALAEGGSLAVEGVLEGAAEEDHYVVQLESATGSPPPPPPVPSSADGGVPPTRQLSVEITPAETLATRIALRDGTVTAGPPGAPSAPTGKAAPPAVVAPILASSRATAGKRHALPNLAVAAGGRYLLSVRRADVRVPRGSGKANQVPVAPASYLLVLRASPLGAADEREPNDTPATATVTGPAHAEPQLAGFLGGPGDRDLYRVPFGHASGQSRLLVELAPSAEGTATLTATDAQGRRVAQVRGRRGQRVVLRGLTPAALAAPAGTDPGFFYVEVTTEGAGDPFRRYVVGVRSDPMPENEAVDSGAPPGASPQ